MALNRAAFKCVSYLALSLYMMTSTDVMSEMDNFNRALLNYFSVRNDVLPAYFRHAFFTNKGNISKGP